MDFLNKAYAQIADLFRTMTPGARITAGLLLAVVVVSLGYLFNSQISGPSADLMQGVPISPNEMPKMLAAFDKANLKGAKPENSRIYVPRGQEAAYMGALVANNALPTNMGDLTRKAIESSSNPFMNDKERSMRMKVAKEELLGMIISKMPGMDYGNVILDSDTTNSFKKEKILTATATAKLQGTAQLDEETVNSIRQLVRGAVAGMKPEDVTVIDQNGRCWPGTPEAGGGAGADQFTQSRRINERDIKQNIANILSYIPGVTVSTSVKLDTTRSTRTTEIKHDKPIPIKEMEATTSNTSDSAGSGGPAGFASQQPNQGMSLPKTSSGSKTEENTSKTEATNIVSGTQTDSVKVGLTPIMATASIGIPSSYIKNLWLADNPQPAGKDQKGPDAAALAPLRAKIIAEVKEQVKNLLPSPGSNADAADLVQVTIFQEVPAALPPEPSLAKNAMLWLGDYWSIAGMIGLAGISLVMLRSLVKSAPPALTMNTGPRLANTPGEETEETTDKPGAPHARRFTTGPSLRDEISTLVQDDPDTAANILKTWIGQGIIGRG